MPPRGFTFTSAGDLSMYRAIAPASIRSSCRVVYFFIMVAGITGLPSKAQESRQRTEKPTRIIVFGAHPDDCELSAGGTAARWAKLGHKVKFVSVTNGDIGHHQMAGAML